MCFPFIDSISLFYPASCLLCCSPFLPSSFPQERQKTFISLHLFSLFSLLLRLLLALPFLLPPVPSSLITYHSYTFIFMRLFSFSLSRSFIDATLTSHCVTDHLNRLDHLSMCVNLCVISFYTHFSLVTWITSYSSCYSRYSQPVLQ